MRPGSPGFVGKRLAEAREARGLSPAALAYQLDISRQLVGQYEAGKTTPGPDTALRIASTLNVPLSYFWLPPGAEDESAIFYRSLKSTAKTERATAKRRLGWLKRIVLYLQEFVDLPEVDFPNLDIPRSPTPLTPNAIEDIAQQVRRHWDLGDGPISNVLWLTENNGAVVARAALDAATLDGLSGWLGDGQRPYVVLGADKQSAVRSRFDVAHELGHLVIHRFIPKAIFNVPEFHSLCEAQADIFASAFLLPAHSFARDLPAPTLDGMRALKPQWRVSIRAMIMRAKCIDLISEDEARKLHISLNRRNWRLREPLDDELVPEDPRVLRRAFNLLAEARVTTPEDIVDSLSLHPQDIIELAGLDSDYFGESAPKVRLTDQARSATQCNTPQPVVLPFRSSITNQPPRRDAR